MLPLSFILWLAPIVNFISSLYVFLVFLGGCTLINIFIFCLFTFRKTTDQKKLRYHQLLCWAANWAITHIPGVRTTWNDYDKKSFDKPAVIISNHQSHFDLMCMMGLTPKLIILTNDWVWNSIFYGRIIRYADYFPVSNGVEKIMDKLETVVNKGYSVVVFPEGTRSEDCSIQRFHQGAFYLAEKLQLEIIPVLLHGVGHLLPKRKLLIRKGAIHIKVMERIAYHTLGETSIQRAKNMRAFYKEEYAKLAMEIEQT